MLRLPPKIWEQSHSELGELEIVYFENEDTYFLFNNEGVPLGLIEFNEEADDVEEDDFDFYFFNTEIPLGYLPQTGIVSMSILLLGMGVSFVGAGLVIRRKRK